MTPILDNEDSADRFTILPILNPDIWDLYKKAVAATWFVNEITLQDDVIVWNDDSKLSDADRHFITTVLSFFAGADKLVADNINTSFIHEVKMMEAEFFYDHQCLIERFHAEVYANLIATYIQDADERTRLFQSLKTIPVVKRKGEYAAKYANAETSSFPERLIAFAIFEGVYFSASFASIFYYKKKGLLDGMCTSNDFISRDEALHCMFACALYKHVIDKLPVERVHEMYREAVEIESEFVREALKTDLVGMSADQMCQYVQFTADFWLNELGYPSIYNVKNPFNWMHLISMESKINFFEKRVTDYAMGGSQRTEDNCYGEDQDF